MYTPLCKKIFPETIIIQLRIKIKNKYKDIIRNDLILNSSVKYLMNKSLKR